MITRTPTIHDMLRQIKTQLSDGLPNDNDHLMGIKAGLLGRAPLTMREPLPTDGPGLVAKSVPKLQFFFGTPRLRRAESFMFGHQVGTSMRERILKDGVECHGCYSALYDLAAKIGLCYNCERAGITHEMTRDDITAMWRRQAPKVTRATSFVPDLPTA